MAYPAICLSVCPPTTKQRASRDANGNGRIDSRTSSGSSLTSKCSPRSPVMFRGSCRPWSLSSFPPTDFRQKRSPGSPRCQVARLGKIHAGRSRSFSSRDAIYPILRPRSVHGPSFALGITGPRPSRRSGPAIGEGPAPPPDRTGPSTPEPDQCATS